MYRISGRLDAEPETVAVSATWTDDGRLDGRCHPPTALTALLPPGPGPPHHPHPYIARRVDAGWSKLVTLHHRWRAPSTARRPSSPGAAPSHMRATYNAPRRQQMTPG